MANEERSFYPLYTRSSTTGTVTTQGTLRNSVTVSANAGAQTTALPTTGAANIYNQIQIANTGALWAYVNFSWSSGGAVAAASVASSYPVAPNSVVVVSVDPEVDQVSTILTAAGPQNVTFTRGEGI